MAFIHTAAAVRSGMLGICLLGVCSHSMAESDQHGPGSAEHRNHLSVLLGATDHDRHTEFTIGLDYEYRINERIGLGAVLEHAGGDIDASTLLGVADIHFGEGWALQTGPGIERIDEHGHTEHEFVYRIGLLYEIEFDQYTVSPQLHYDWTNAEDSVVFGFAFGFHY